LGLEPSPVVDSELVLDVLLVLGLCLRQC
jgi:hypothetical protein